MAIPKYRLFKARNKGFVEFRGKRHYLLGIYDSPESIEAYTEFIQQNCTSSKATLLAENIKHGTLINTMCLAYLQWAKVEYQDQSDNSYYMQMLTTAKHFGAYFADMKTLNFPCQAPQTVSRISHQHRQTQW